MQGPGSSPRFRDGVSLEDVACKASGRVGEIAASPSHAATMAAQLTGGQALPQGKSR